MAAQAPPPIREASSAAPPPQTLAEQALEKAVGAALVLDDELRVRAVTRSASVLLGFVPPIGASAPSLLCGSGPSRPVAEALAAGRPIQAILPRKAVGDTMRGAVRVRSVRLDDGWLLLLGAFSGDMAAGAVEFLGMWTQDARTKDVFRIIERVADGDDTVLVRGETGAGKELVAAAIHALSSRRAGPFRAINCAALPAALLESELFGHVRGAFTGAHKDTVGHVQLAHKGSLFLDEVAELPLELQAKLLRVLETRSVIPVGGRQPIPVDVRVISATHRALRREVDAGRFRADLMYRLRVIPIFLPPLRERHGDVALLCDQLTRKMNATRKRQITELAPAALAALERHDWPGNVRELQNVLAYAYALGDGPTLALTDLPAELVEPSLMAAEQVTPPAAPRVTHDPELARLLGALEAAGGNRRMAATLLGVSRVTLWRRLKELGIDGGEAS